MIWQTRVLAQFIAATVPVESEGSVNELLQAANDIGRPRKDTDRTPQGGAEPVGAAAKPIEPKAGSYEAFMATFARAMR